MSPLNLRSPHGKKQKAFSLIELLAVMTIVGIMTAAGIATMSGMQRSTDLTSGVGKLIDILSLSRQAAITSNLPIEVRIYEKDGQYSLTLYRVVNGGSSFEKFGQTFVLPKTVTISTNANWSSILSEAVGGPVKQDSTGFSYHSFRFLPNGSTNLEGSNGPTLTVIFRSDANRTDLPPNFFTLQLDLQTGLIKTFRPS